MIYCTQQHDMLNVPSQLKTCLDQSIYGNIESVIQELNLGKFEPLQNFNYGWNFKAKDPGEQRVVNLLPETVFVDFYLRGVEHAAESLVYYAIEDLM